MYDRKWAFFTSYSLFEAHIRAFKNTLTSFSIYFILSKKTSPYIENIIETPIYKQDAAIFYFFIGQQYKKIQSEYGISIPLEKIT